MAVGQALAWVLAATGVAAAIQFVVPAQDPAIVFLTAVLLSAVLGGRVAGVTAALLSVVVVDVLFIPPRFSLRIGNPEDVVSLIVFMVVAAVGSTLTARLRRQTEAARQLVVQRAGQNKIEAIIESLDDGVLVVARGGEVLHVNEVACAILGVERGGVLGQPFDSLGSQHSHYLRLRETIREMLRDPERPSQPVELSSFLRGRDHHYVLRHSPLRGGGAEPGGIILVLQDVTHLRDHDARREDLIGTLSHELRTPLTSLRMAAELLVRDGAMIEPRQRRLVDAVQEDVARLEDLAQRLLDLSRTRATSIALERRPVRLDDLIERVRRVFSLQAEEHGVTLVATGPGVDFSIEGDPTKLTWALSNLVANALRYTPSGGRIAVEASVGAETVRIAVVDNGRGIPENQRERIFDRFTQDPDGDNVGSAGLGLAIVRDIVQAHGGRIYVDSTVGQGSRFEMEIPRG